MYIGDRLINDVPPKDRDIAMVFQNYALYPVSYTHLDVYKRQGKGRRADDLHLPAGERGLHDVGSIHRAVRITGTHDGVNLICLLYTSRCV